MQNFPVTPTSIHAVPLVVFLILLGGCVTPRPVREVPVRVQTVYDIAAMRGRALADSIRRQALPVELPPSATVDTVIVDTVRHSISIEMNRAFSFIAFREENVRAIKQYVSTLFAPAFNGYSIAVRTLDHPLEDLIPNYYRSSPALYDLTRMPVRTPVRPEPIVRSLNTLIAPAMGLAGRNIVVSPSHGWYYSKDRDRWEWQRPRLFQAVEDLIPLSFTLPYIVPMLENAGANVFVPRERDPQVHEIIVDNDDNSLRHHAGMYREIRGTRSRPWKKGKGTGYGFIAPPLRGNENPFAAGTHRIVLSDTAGLTSATWIPDIPANGDYAVYVSYSASDSNVADAHYTVSHDGGATEFVVNQRIGGQTWTFLGRFRFHAGVHPATGKVVLRSKSATPGKLVSADALKFGGGMGMISRNGRLSGKPRFEEGARYYLQFNGMPDTLVYSVTKFTDDYRDDYSSRPEYANYLKGAPYGPNKNRSAKGLGIPVDLCLSFHTDAGITHTDTTVGTLAIYSVEGADSQHVFPDSVSRLANRDLADIVQSQIVSDLRARFDPKWTRRDLRDAKYAESVRPNMPSLLLELLSHQNFLDMKFVLDPRFRFTAARSVYKGILRFLSVQYGVPYVVQPLPVTHFAASLTGSGEAKLTWRPQVDSLEPGAFPRRYVVYKRVGDGGFDNGTAVDSPAAAIGNIRPGTIYSFKVTAANEGGESFPSEILSVARARASRGTALVVNGFDRIAPPASVESSAFEGFLNFIDPGVPDRYDFSFTGPQFDFDPGSAYRTNDGPGHGASHSDREGGVIAGNTFDFTVIHGNALLACGYSYSSASRVAVLDSAVDLAGFRFVDLVLGREKETHWPKAVTDSLRGTAFTAFPPRLRALLRDYAAANGHLFVSGAYVGSDIFAKRPVDSIAANFSRDVLHSVWATDHASLTGSLMAVDTSFMDQRSQLRFRTVPDGENYGVDSPDAIEPFGGGATLLRYAENQFSAAVGYRSTSGVILCGFPFETLVSSADQVLLMKSVLHYFGL